MVELMARTSVISSSALRVKEMPRGIEASRRLPCRLDCLDRAILISASVVTWMGEECRVATTLGGLMSLCTSL